MKQERKHINVIKRLSREASSVGDSSFGSDYHRDSPVSVPFVWESEPGTPKHKFHDQRMPLPPLTPPPSYKLHSYGGGASRQSKPTNLIHTLFSGSSRKGGKDINTSSSASSSPASPLSSQWSSSSSSTPSTSPGSRKCFHGRRSSGQRMTSFDSRLEEEEEEEFGEFSVSGLFYSVGDGGTNRAPYRGCCSAMMKIFKG